MSDARTDSKPDIRTAATGEAASSSAAISGAATPDGTAARSKPNAPVSRQRAELESPVDMLQIARTAQIEGAGLKVVAPAKVNLYLGVGAQREDGYHEVSTVLHALALHDLLFMRASDPLVAKAALAASEEAGAANVALAGPAGNIIVAVACEAKGGVEPLSVNVHNNLVFKAIDALAKKIDLTQEGALSVRIEKSIPAEAGLGGGSSNAAAALVGAAQLWGLAVDDPRIEEAARELGSDVAFFLHGGCARFGGAGDAFEAQLEPWGQALVLVKPEPGVSTAEAYRAFDEAPEPPDEDTAAAVASAVHAKDVPLTNTLAGAAERVLPELAEVRAWLNRQAGVTGIQLCGSGSCTFALCQDFSAACAIAAAAQSRGWWARTTMLSSLKAAVVPDQR